TVTSGTSGTLTNIKINFQDSASVPPVGWLRDYGQAFGLRSSAYQGSGNAYGWIKRADNTAVNLTKNGRKRTAPANNILQATLMHMQASDVPSTTLTRIEGIWECQVASGNYKVTLSVGDGEHTDSKHSINIEGVSAVSNFIPISGNLFKVVTLVISVSDGYMTIDAKGGKNTKINYVIIQPDTSKRPSVVTVNPQNSSISVNENSSISTGILKLPNSGVKNSTITTSNVYLAEEGTGILVPSTVNGTGGGDAITLVPNDPLDLSTTYRFTITSGVQDLSDSAFIPYSSSFTTGSSSTSDIINAQFDKILLSNIVGQHSSLTIGPDRKLYALTIDGIIKRFPINADGTLGTPQLIYTLQDKSGTRTPRLAIGLTFDPAATVTNLILWVTHSTFVFLNGPEWDGKLSKLSGSNLETITDVIINLPRSKKDHLSNSIAFGPDNALYFSQGCNSAMGRADRTWGNRNEQLLAGACLRLDLSKVNSFPLDAKTPDGGGTYNPYAINAPLTLYATGLRNAYDLLWHSNGELYLPTNGSAAGGNTPASVPGTIRPDGTPYNGPDVPALTSVQQTQKDFLFRITKGGYYGHPNPLRGEYVMNGGNPTSPIDPAQVTDYPLGTPPDANYRGYAFDFQNNKSPNGVIEYKSNTFNGALKGKIMVVRYSQNNDIITLTPGGAENDIVSSTEGSAIVGFSGFNDPLDLTEDTTTGNIYVSEYGDSGKIILLKPKNIIIQQPPVVTLSPLADATIRNGSYANTNYGKDTTLRVKTSPSLGYNRKSFLKFSVDTASLAKISNITSAKLRLYGRNTESFASIYLPVSGVPIDAWTETGITWNNAPSTSTFTLSVIGVSDQLKYYDFDVTAFVKQEVLGDKIVSFLIKDSSVNDRKFDFNSRQNLRFPPQLVIKGDLLTTLKTSAKPTNKIMEANSNVSKSRTANDQTPVPIVHRSLNIKKLPECDEPGDDYTAADTATNLSPLLILPSKRKDNSIAKLSKPSIYPNPVQNIFHIIFPSTYEGKYHLELIDLPGRSYELGTLLLRSGGSNVDVDISKLSLKPGLYFIRINSSKKSTDVFKLLIQY
ncbi:MAG: DNRLRE domain-containing protein, partial [Ginsengibacter sp.]